MRIAVNTRFLLPGKLEGLGWYSHELLRRMVHNHPEDEFIFLFDRPFDKQFVYADNVLPVVVSPPARHPVLWYLWFEWAVPPVLKRYAPDAFFSPDGFCSLSTRVNTVMTLHDLIPLHYPEKVPWVARQYYLRYLPRYVERADHIVTVSEFVRKDIVQTCGVEEQKVSVVYNGIREIFRPAEQEVRLAVRKKWSGGNPYFLYTGAIHPRKNVDLLIRAFDLFKSGDQCNVQLLLAGRFAWQTGAVKSAYESAAHKSDIHFLGYVPDEDLPGLYASALALVNLSASEGFGLPLVEAMACGTQVIASDIEVFREVGGDLADYVNPEDPEQVSNAFLKYSNEKVERPEVSKLLHDRGEMFSWDRAAQKVYGLF